MEEIAYIVMTAEGGVTYQDVLGMDERERAWWVDKCNSINEERNRK
jgi:hypothetical protein